MHKGSVRGHSRRNVARFFVASGETLLDWKAAAMWKLVGWLCVMGAGPRCWRAWALSTLLHTGAGFAARPAPSLHSGGEAPRASVPAAGRGAPGVASLHSPTA